MTFDPKPAQSDADAMRQYRDYLELRRANQPADVTTTLSETCPCGLSTAIAGHRDDYCCVCGELVCRSTMQTVRVPGESLDVCRDCAAGNEE